MDFSFTRDGNNPQLAVIKLLYGFIVAHSPELTALVFASLFGWRPHCHHLPEHLALVALYFLFLFFFIIIIIEHLLFCITHHA